MKKETPKFFFALRKGLEKEKQFLPTRAEAKATGWDVRAAIGQGQQLTLKPFQTAKIPLGIRGFCPEGWWYELKPRSSSFAKKNLHALYGTIDETYEGELLFACQYIPEIVMSASIWEESGFYDSHLKVEVDFDSVALTINHGDAIGQIIPVKRKEMEVIEISNKDYDFACKERAAQRGAGGFGSTTNGESK